MRSLLDYICACLVTALGLIFYLLPMKFTLWLARRCSIIVYFLNRPRRIIAYANLRAAFSGNKSPAELKKLTRKVYQGLTQVFFEIISLTKVDKKYIDKHVEIVGGENFYKIEGHPDGVIFLTAHFGNWELSGVVSALIGLPLIVLAREQNMKRLDNLLNRLRRSKGLTVVTKGITIKYIVKALHEGKIIGMLGDQNAGKTGEQIEFFGRPAATAPGTVRIAAKTGALILPAFMARVKGPYHRLMVGEPIRIKKGEDIKPYLEKYNKLLEKYVTMYPDQWLWLHKRWKASSLKKVVVLNDGKAGHLNQSLAVCRELKRYRKKDDYREEDTRVEVVDIRFKNETTKALLKFCSIFSGKRCQGCMRCLKFCLTESCYNELMGKYADIVISCGSGTAAVNRFFSVENNAKSAAIMNPSIPGFDKFDMVVLPRHDRIIGRARDHVIRTEIVPNLIDEERMNSAAGKISDLARLKNPQRIGVLLGGDNSDFTLTPEITEKVLNGVINASEIADADILFTTSRRTPAQAEKAVKERLLSEKRCGFLVIANEKNIPRAVDGILGLCDAVVVSGESASMVSEAVQSGKSVIVFRLNSRKKNPSRIQNFKKKFFKIPAKAGKFERMLNGLEKKGYITIVEPDEISKAICENLEKLGKRPPQRHMHDVYMHMWRLGV